MSMDFTFVFICETSTLDSLFEGIVKQLHPLGFSRGNEVLVSSPEDDPYFDQEITLHAKDLVEGKSSLHGWRSIYMNFFSSDYSFGLQFDLGAQGMAEGYLFIDMKKMRRLHKDVIPGYFYDMISGIAALAEANGGYGGFEAAQTPKSPQQTLKQLLSHPGDHDEWFDIHIVEIKLLASVDLNNAWARDFERVERRGFVFFIERDFLALCKEFG